MNTKYRQHIRERAALGIPPLPLAAEQVRELTTLLEDSSCDSVEQCLELLIHYVTPEDEPAAETKANWLASVALGGKYSPFVTQEKAARILGTMPGRHSISHLVSFLDDLVLAPIAAEALKHLIVGHDRFDDVRRLADRRNRLAGDLLKSWSTAEWFFKRPEVPETMLLKVYRVEGEVDTDDLSPPQYSESRNDIPLHALLMGEKRFPAGADAMTGFRQTGALVTFVADVLRDGADHESAVNSLMWHTGVDIPFVPNRRRGGVVLAGRIMAGLYRTLENSGGLAVECDVRGLRTGDTITLCLREGVEQTVEAENGRILSGISLPSDSLEAYRAGGKSNLVCGRRLTAMAREELSLPDATVCLNQLKTG